MFCIEYDETSKCSPCSEVMLMFDRPFCDVEVKYTVGIIQYASIFQVNVLHNLPNMCDPAYVLL